MWGVCFGTQYLNFHICVCEASPKVLPLNATVSGSVGAQFGSEVSVAAVHSYKKSLIVLDLLACAWVFCLCVCMVPAEVRRELSGSLELE